MKNRITTLGYFKKRLRDNGFIVINIFNNYSTNDKRKWTIMVNPGNESLYITCEQEKDFDTPVFEFNDGGSKIKQLNLKLSTMSMEVIIEKLLITWKINNNNKNSPYFKTKTIT